MKARIPKDMLEYEVGNLYIQYSEFVNVELPLFKFLYFKNEDNRNFAQVVYPTNDNEQFLLYISKSLNSQDKQSRKNILFHEFTHIWDAIRILPNNFTEEKYQLIEVYSEINASKVEIMSAFNFTSIVINKRISLSDTLNINNKTISLNNWNELSVLRMKDLATDYNKSKSNENFAKLYKHILYCIGYFKFANCFCETSNFDSTLKIFTESFGDVFVSLYENIPNDFHVSIEMLIETLLKKCKIMQQCSRLQNNFTETQHQEMDSYLNGVFDNIVQKFTIPKTK